MATEQKWGRKESFIWPPRGFYYTWGAAFCAILLTGFLLFLRFDFGLDALERYYLPYYLRSAMNIRPTAKFQLLYVSDGAHSRLAVPEDVQDGTTDQPSGKPLPLVVSDATNRRGIRWLLREPERVYPSKAVHLFLTQGVYAGEGVWSLFAAQIYFGFTAFLLQLPFALPRDIKRRKELRYGRRLKGPVLVNAQQFNAAVMGDGIGIQTEDIAGLLRIPARAENQHILAIGDTGSGKTSVIRQLAYRVQERDECAIIYDPAGEFIRQFYNETRGDIVLNPQDARMPYWNPAEEVDDEPEALALAESFYQPDQVQNQFFVDSPQKIFAYLISQQPKPRPEDLVQWMSSKHEIEMKLKDTEHAVLVDQTAGPQRAGVLSSLNKIATTLRMLPTVADHPVSEWTAKAWSEHRRGWIFLTSTTTTRKAIRPLHCVWLDMLVMHLLSTRRPDQKRVWFLIDELASLQKLPQLHTALTENRKSENPVVLGFQGRSQLETRYGNDAEAMLSQPATKIFFRTDEPRAAKWISDNIGEVEIERLKETHYDGGNRSKNFTLERLREPLVMPSEIQGLVDLSAYLKYGNYVAHFSIPFVKLEDKHPDFIRRKRPAPVTVPGSTAETVTDSAAVVEESTGDDLGMQVV
jgi:Type IV secretion-system coupling protein DNA-binding domain